MILLQALLSPVRAEANAEARDEAYSTDRAYPELALYDGDSLQIQHLTDVEVDATPLKVEIIPAHRLEGETLEQLQCQSVADAVRYFSGVQIKDYGGIGGLKTINIRSMGSQLLGVFYDGLPVGNAQNGQIDLGRFSLDNIEAISLYNGQRASMLQSARDYASATSLYLQSRQPVFSDGKPCHVSLGWRGGSFGLQNPSLLWQQKISPSVSASFSGEYVHAHGRYKFHYRKYNPDGSLAYDTAAIRQNADVEALRAEASLMGFLENGQWKLQVYSYRSERGLPGYVARNLYNHTQRQWDRNLFAQGAFRKYYEGYSLLVNAKYARDYTRYLNNDTTLQYVDNQYWQQEAYASVAQTWRLSDAWQFALSTDWQWNGLESDMNLFQPKRRHTLLGAASLAYRQAKWQAQASAIGTYVWEQGETRKLLTPSLTFHGRPAPSLPLDLRAFYKRIYRLPTFNELYYTLVGQSLLKPEYATQFDLGASWNPIAEGIMDAWQVEADVYYNIVEDKIVAVPTSNPFRWQMMNLGLVHIVGGDLQVGTHWQFGPETQLQIQGNYTYQQARDLTDPDELYYGDQIPYIPKHSGSLTALLDRGPWDLHYSFIYTGARYDQSANIPANYIQPWYTHDLALGRNFDCCGTRIKVSGEINNIFNQAYDVVLNYPMPGTNFKLILKVNL